MQASGLSRDCGLFLWCSSIYPAACCFFRGGFRKRRHQVAAEQSGSRHKTTQAMLP